MLFSDLLISSLILGMSLSSFVKDVSSMCFSVTLFASASSGRELEWGKSSMFRASPWCVFLLEI